MNSIAAESSSLAAFHGPHTFVGLDKMKKEPIPWALVSSSLLHHGRLLLLLVVAGVTKKAGGTGLEGACW